MNLQEVTKSIKGSSSTTKLGLLDSLSDHYTDTYFKIFYRNIFSIINITLFPLLSALFFFQLYLEIFVFSTFLIINTILAIVDEVRAKNKLEKLKTEFQFTTNVIREGKVINIPIKDVLEEEFILAKEGEMIITDGVVNYEYYLQVDESMLTGESNYIEKDIGDEVKAGSYVVTGYCIYQAKRKNETNFVNQIANEALKYKKRLTNLQTNGNKLIQFLVVCALICSLLNFYVTQNNFDVKERLLSATTIISLIIPQTLILLFNLAFTISVVRLTQKKIIVQKSASIEELSKVNVICFDKTGTLTTNKMFLKYVKTFNCNLQKIASIYTQIIDKLVSTNETQKVINDYFKQHTDSRENSTINMSYFDQIPFTSKRKFSLVNCIVNKEDISIALGAKSALLEKLDKDIQDQVEKYILSQEKEGYRVVLCGYKSFKIQDPNKEVANINEKFNSIIFDSCIVFSIEEEINKGINELINYFSLNEIKTKVISGDSSIAVERIAKKLNLDNLKIADLSKEELDKVVIENIDIFTRVTPEQKLYIINYLQSKGMKVAMVGDGINDVLALKKADVSISLGSGTKVAREISNIVLLDNDYKKVPEIFNEGLNVYFNLEISSKIFLLKAFMGIFFSIILSLYGLIMPWNPTSTLIFSFLGSSLISYLVIFTRQKLEYFKNIQKNFFKNIITSSVLASTILTTIITIIYFLNKSIYDYKQLSTMLVLAVLSFSIMYALIILYNANKIKKLYDLAYSYIILILLGIFQTILPPFQDKYTNLDIVLIYILMIFTFILSTNFVRKYINIRKPKDILLLYIFGIFMIFVGTVFPFQSYYSTVNIPIELIITSLSVTILAGILFYLIEKLLVIKTRKLNTV